MTARRSACSSAPTPRPGRSTSATSTCARGSTSTKKPPPSRSRPTPGPHHEPGGRAEELPTIFKGVPVQLKALNVIVNRPEFQFNPTNCDPLSIGALTGRSEGGQPEQLDPVPGRRLREPDVRAQVHGLGERRRAAKPTARPSRVTVESGGIGAEGIRKVFLTIPKILPARLQPTLQNACLDKVFDDNPASCPEDSVIGTATVHTPVLKNPLVGPGDPRLARQRGLPRRRVRAPGRRHPHPARRQDRHQKRRHLLALRIGAGRARSRSSKPNSRPARTRSSPTTPKSSRPTTSAGRTSWRRPKSPPRTAA